MKHPQVLAMLTLGLGTLMSAQTATESHAKPTPSGTTVTKQQMNTEVQPVTKQVGVTPDIIRAAQAKLNVDGFKAGDATGQMNASTRRAIRAFQAKEKLTNTGRLDENTLSHLNIGGRETFGAAPSDLGRGGKAAGHDIAGGHPIAGTVAMGKGVGRFGKKVGEGTKSLAITGKDKVAGDKAADTAAPPRN